MKDNITIYTVTGEVEPSPTGSVRSGPPRVSDLTSSIILTSSATGSDNDILAPYSSTYHEITRLNARSSGSYTYVSESSRRWSSFSGRRTSFLTASQYGGQTMYQPTAQFGGYYTKNFITGSDNPKFRRLIYALNADDTGSDPAIGAYWKPADGAAEATLDTQLGRLVDANPRDTFQAAIPIAETGKIRDIKVWVDLVHRDRDESHRGNGLKGLQIALVSPNVRSRGAYPLWNMRGTENFLYDANPNLTGTENLVGNAIQRSQPEIFASGAYILWDGHDANSAMVYATGNLGIYNNSSEFDTDLDMRTIFSDSSNNLNPRSRIKVFLSATDDLPGFASNLTNTLISSTNGFAPLNYYYSPSNFAMRNHSGSFSWSGQTVTVTGAGIPWYVDSRISNNFTEQVLGAPPDGWLTGDPNALFRLWAEGSSTLSNTGTLWGYVTGIWTGATTQTKVFSAGTTQFAVGEYAISGVMSLGDSIRIVDNLTASNVHDATVTAFYYPSIVSGKQNHYFSFTPATTVIFNTDAKIYLRNHVSTSLGAALGTYTGGYYYDYDYDLETAFQYPDENFIFNNTNTFPAIDARQTIKWGNVFYKTLYRNNNVYIEDQEEGTVIDGPFGVIGLDTYSTGAYQQIFPKAEVKYTYAASAYAATASYASTGPDNILSSSFNLGNRWGFSYTFVPPNQMILLGGYTGSVASPVAGNFVDIITFSGSAVSGAFRTGTVSNAAADGGTKTNRKHGGLYSMNLKPDNAATFYVAVGGAVNTTLAITESSVLTYSTASVASVTWSAPYSYKYWRQADYYAPDIPEPCLDPSTPVYISEGITKPLDQIKVGDLLWTRPEMGGDMGMHRVDLVRHTRNSRCKVIFTDGRDFTCSINHLLNVKGIWRRADSLQPAEEVQGEPNGWVAKVEYLGEGPIVQLVIPTAGTYFAGNGCWHHNTLCP